MLIAGLASDGVRRDETVQLLLLDRSFPRSVMYCLTEVEGALRAVSGTTFTEYTNIAERRLGQLRSELHDASVEASSPQGCMSTSTACRLA